MDDAVDSQHESLFDYRKNFRENSRMNDTKSAKLIIVFCIWYVYALSYICYICGRGYTAYKVQHADHFQVMI